MPGQSLPLTASASASAELRMLPVLAIRPCPIQPRTNPQLRMIGELTASMRAGRHQPLLEVEEVIGEEGKWQIVCGEQRWRAARDAELSEVLARVLPRLTYQGRLQKQLEENWLRADLDVVEEARAIVQYKVLADIRVAETLLADRGVEFERLDAREITNREDFAGHLGRLKALLCDHGVQTQLSRWHDTEAALHISESQRKQKVGILRLPAEVQEGLAEVSAEHAIQIARLSGEERQRELAQRAPELTHRQVRQAVKRLQEDSELSVATALAEGVLGPAPASGEGQLEALADLCRQLARRLALLRAAGLSQEERSRVRAMLASLSSEMGGF